MGARPSDVGVSAATGVADMLDAAGMPDSAGLLPGATALGGDTLCCAAAGVATHDAQSIRTALSFLFTAIIIHPKHSKPIFFNA